MIYGFNYVASKYKSLMWTAITLRWLAHLAIAHMVFVSMLTAFGYLQLLASDSKRLAIQIFLFLLMDLSVMLLSPTYRRFVKVWSFRRTWPHTWLTVKNQTIDPENKQKNSWLNAPKLGLFHRRINNAVIFKVRPAKGSTLAKLNEQSNDLAAQHSSIDTIEIAFNKPSDHKGELKILLGDSLAEIKTPDYERLKHVSSIN